MSWYNDNGKIAWLIFIILFVFVLITIEACNGCVNTYWEIASPSNENQR